jgi:hypothetical protein
MKKLIIIFIFLFLSGNLLAFNEENISDKMLNDDFFMKDPHLKEHLLFSKITYSFTDHSHLVQHIASDPNLLERAELLWKEEVTKELMIEKILRICFRVIGICFFIGLLGILAQY